ncbi:MAG: LD-carboxypeptidase [Bdellovibrionota bacterium]|nr:MAG: LD-carboxypeptidase [Bdellovibrionota bacterium]
MAKSETISWRPCLSPGDTIGVIATSGPSNPEWFHKAIKALESFGYRAKVALDPTRYYGSTQCLFSSDTPKQRAEALTQLFMDPEVRCIVASRGSYGAIEILPHLDFERIRAAPKPFIGFSDTTVLLTTLADRAQVPTVHGPNIEATFGKTAQSTDATFSVESLLMLLSSGSLERLAALPRSILFGSGEMQGRVTGGNLMSLVSLLGTPFSPAFDDRILFLEEVREKPYKVHRALMQLALAGKLEKLAGVLLGDFIDCVHEKGLGPTLEDVLKDIFAQRSYPVLRVSGLGHGARNCALPFGVPLRISANHLEFSRRAGL